MQDINELYFPEWVKKEWAAIIAYMEEFSSTPEGKQFLRENDPRMAIVADDQMTMRMYGRLKDPSEGLKGLSAEMVSEWDDIISHMKEFNSSIAGQWFLRENDPRELVLR